MRLRGKAHYYPVLQIPAGRRGRFAVEHKTRPAGHVFQLSTPRNALFGIKQPTGAVSFPDETRWHVLKENGATWMTDVPIEQRQCDELVKGMHGRVLVGGLGLGYAVTALARKRDVTQIVVVERAPELRELVWEHLSPRVHRKAKLVTADLFRYLRTHGDSWFQCGYYDIWAGDGESTFHSKVVPLRRLSRNIVGNVVCWQEDVMRAQLANGLLTRLLLVHGGSDGLGLADQDHFVARALTERSIYVRWARPFWQWHQAERPSLSRASAAARDWARSYGIDYMEGIWRLTWSSTSEKTAPSSTSMTTS